jgi:hypothetical protein
VSRTVLILILILSAVVILGALGANPFFREEIVVGGGILDADGGSELYSDGSATFTGTVTAPTFSGDLDGDPGPHSHGDDEVDDDITISADGSVALGALEQGGATDGQGLVWDNTAGTWAPDNIPGNVTDFLDLTDTPASYSGQGGKLLAVNSTPDGVEFIDTPDTFLALNLNGTSTQERALNWQTSGGARWRAVVTGLESSGDLGSDFSLNAYDDNEVLIDSPITIPRISTGQIQIGFGGDRDILLGGVVKAGTSPVTLTNATGRSLLAALEQGGATDGQVLTWSTANSRWQPGNGSSGSRMYLDVRDIAISVENAEEDFILGFSATRGPIIPRDSTLTGITLSYNLATVDAGVISATLKVYVNGSAVHTDTLPLTTGFKTYNEISTLGSVTALDMVAVSVLGASDPANNLWQADQVSLILEVTEN